MQSPFLSRPLPLHLRYFLVRAPFANKENITARHQRCRQALRRQRSTARRIGGCDKHYEYNDAQPDRFSHGWRDRDVRYARTFVNAHYESKAFMQPPFPSPPLPLHRRYVLVRASLANKENITARGWGLGA